MMALFTLGLMMCVMFCGLSLDIGLLELQKTQMQTAADAAAIAADMYFERVPTFNGTLGTEATNAAAQYGFVDGANQTTVTATASLSAAAVGGDYNGHHDTVQVTITRQVPTMFMGLLNQRTVTVSAMGTASPPPCQYYLGTKNLVTPTVLLANTAATEQLYSKCSAYIGGGMINPTGAWWQAWQTYFTGPPSASSLLGRTKQGTTFNATVRGDPLAGIAQPTVGACASTNYTRGNLGSATTTVTLSPGVYCGSFNAGVVTPGMTLLKVKATFNPGLYVITGGVKWQKLSATGTGATFFFTNVGGTSKYGTIALFNGANSLNLSASSGSAFGTTDSNGATAGILFFVDRNWVNTGPHDFSISLTNGTLTYSGVWYLPYTGLSVQDGVLTCTVYCAIVADNLYQANLTHNMTGTDYTQFPGLNPLRSTSVLVQ